MKIASFNIVSALVIAAIIIIQGPEPGAGDDIGTNFFLKASKSVPRIGRRSMDFDNHFLKASKSVPRIGRRGGITETGRTQDMKGYPIVRNNGPEIYLAETGAPLWSDIERVYESYPRMENLAKFREDFDGNEAYWQRVKKDSEIEEPRIQAEVF